MYYTFSQLKINSDSIIENIRIDDVDILNRIRSYKIEKL